MLARHLRLEMSRLTGELIAQRVDVLAVGVEHGSDGRLRQPVDPQIRDQRAQFVGNGQVAAHVSKTDRTADEQSALLTTSRSCPGGRSRAVVTNEVVDQ